MNAFLAVVKKELTAVLRERTIVIAIVLQLFIASFSSALLSGMLALYDPDTIAQYGGANIHVGVVYLDPDSENAGKFSELLRKQGLSVSAFSSLDDAKQSYADGELEAIAVIPQEGEISDMTLILPQSQVESSLVRLVIQKPLKQFENYLREKNGVAVRYTDLGGTPNTSFEFIYSMLLPILMFFPAFVAGGVVIDSVSEEVEGNTLPTLLSAPLSVNQVIGAKIVSSVVLAAVQILAWLGLVRLNGVQVQNGGWMFLMAVIIAGILAASGGLVAAVFKDRERSQFVFSLFLLAAAGASYLLDLSPIQVIARLAVGDLATNGWDVALFGGVLAGVVIVLLRSTRRLLAV
jgi:ABC-2 type transport system permease protein